MSWQDYLASKDSDNLMDGESPTDDISWRGIPRISHVGMVAWKKNPGQRWRDNRNPLGTLFIWFSTGGHPRMWMYPDVPYRTFYYLWRGAIIHGKYVYYTFLRERGFIEKGVAIGD